MLAPLLADPANGESAPASAPAIAAPVVEPEPVPAGPQRMPSAGDPAAAPQLEFAAFHDKTFVEARRSGAPVALYFEADWCLPCRKMHAETFHEPAVLEAAAGYRLFRVDMTRPSYLLELIQKSFRIAGAPTVILFGPDGKERSRRFGFIPAGDLVRMLGEGRKPSSGT